MSALLMASFENRFQIVENLIDAKAIVDHASEDGVMAFMIPSGF